MKDLARSAASTAAEKVDPVPVLRASRLGSSDRGAEVLGSSTGCLGPYAGRGRDLAVRQGRSCGDGGVLVSPRVLLDRQERPVARAVRVRSGCRWHGVYWGWDGWTPSAPRPSRVR
jgi:hypothetical protein